MTLSSFVGEKAVVLVFYPFAFSGVCTGELCEIRDNLPTFESEEVQLLAVSCDPMFALRAFADQDDLTFPLLSDFWPHGAVSSAATASSTRRGAAQRSTFIIDRDGILRWSVHNAMPQARDLEVHARADPDECIRKDSDLLRLFAAFL